MDNVLKTREYLSIRRFNQGLSHRNAGPAGATQSPAQHHPQRSVTPASTASGTGKLSQPQESPQLPGLCSGNWSRTGPPGRGKDPRPLPSPSSPFTKHVCSQGSWNFWSKMSSQILRLQNAVKWEWFLIFNFYLSLFFKLTSTWQKLFFGKSVPFRMKLWRVPCFVSSAGASQGGETWALCSFKSF